MSLQGGQTALISKGERNPEVPSAYLPAMCACHGRKVLETLIRSRLAEAIRAAGNLSPRQFGFRTARSTVDDVVEVVDKVHRAEACSCRSRRIVFLMTLDVRNAVNSVRWTNILGTLKNSFRVSSSLLYEAQRRMEITSGVVQGSILGPHPWNGSYDSLLRLDIRLVGYEEDVAVRTVERAQSISTY